MTTEFFMFSAVAMGTCLVGFPPKSLRRDKGLHGLNTQSPGTPAVRGGQGTGASETPGEGGAVLSTARGAALGKAATQRARALVEQRLHLQVLGCC